MSRKPRREFSGRALAKLLAGFREGAITAPDALTAEDLYLKVAKKALVRPEDLLKEGLRSSLERGNWAGPLTPTQTEIKETILAQLDKGVSGAGLRDALWPLTPTAQEVLKKATESSDASTRRAAQVIEVSDLSSKVGLNILNKAYSLTPQQWETFMVLAKDENERLNDTALLEKLLQAELL